MASDTTDFGTTYSATVGMVYVFNLIVGTGTLALPEAFGNSGWLISLILIVFLAFTSYMTVTFVVESMACANAKDRWIKRQKIRKRNQGDGLPEIPVDQLNEHYDIRTSREEVSTDTEDQPLLASQSSMLDKNDYYDITQKMELGKMASMFYNKVGLYLFYICIIVYLYGDLAIYAAAVPKSLRDVVCTYDPNNKTSSNKSLEEWQPCFQFRQNGLTRFQMYQVFLTVFVVCLVPFTFFNVQKTKYLQILTTVFRWLAFIVMITLASVRLYTGPRAYPSPPAVVASGIPNLFGVCVYAFMCHHSIPSLVTPIRNKEKVNGVIIADYLLILFFYFLLSFTGAFAFSKLDDLYTLNFSPHNPEAAKVPEAWIWILYFVALFPVFTISANFPIISITLRDNLKNLFTREGKQYPWLVDRVMFPLVTAIPPIAVVYFTNDVGLLVGITGSYAGAGIQYVIPAMLVYTARKDLSVTLGSSVKNPHKSVFGHRCWVWLIISWCILCLIFVTWNHINSAIQK